MREPIVKLKKVVAVFAIASTLCSQGFAAAPSGRPCQHCANPSPSIIHGTPDNDNSNDVWRALGYIAIGVIAGVIIGNAVSTRTTGDAGYDAYLQERGQM